MSRAAGKTDADDGAAATAAGLALAAIDAEFVLVTAAQAGAADVIANARSPAIDRPPQHDADRLSQARRLNGVQVNGKRVG